MSTAMQSGAVMNTGNVVRIRGRVKATFPNRGFFFINGDDGVKYFAHSTKVTNGWLILDMHEGQGCEFVPCTGDRRGPSAESIKMDE
jgi:cold shock CspA family protein